ncbi:hypothetical protein [Halobacteriaceae bacterium SHR40]|uniref:hypothetical protein n=1 Tax=Halovenus amylolytica TaxID=2500550 RepID=UPI000FE2C176
MSNGTGDDELEEIMSSFDSEMAQKDENLEEAETSDNQDKLSKEDLEEQFDGEYVASPTGSTQHLVGVDDSQTLCKKDLREKEWPQSSEPGPFNPICRDCKSVFAGPATPTNEAGLGSLNELRNWFAERVDVESAKETSDSKALTKAELQVVVKYIQSLESDNNHEL